MQFKKLRQKRKRHHGSNQAPLTLSTSKDKVLIPATYFPHCYVAFLWKRWINYLLNSSGIIFLVSGIVRWSHASDYLSLNKVISSLFPNAFKSSFNFNRFGFALLEGDCTRPSSLVITHFEEVSVVAIGQIIVDIQTLTTDSNNLFIADFHLRRKIIKRTNVEYVSLATFPQHNDVIDKHKQDSFVCFINI